MAGGHVMEVKVNGLTVLPMNQMINLEPGEIYYGKITVANPQDAVGDLDYQVTVMPYSVTDADYTADLTTVSNRSEMVKWTAIDEPFGTLKPNETKEVEFTIMVPKSAPAGGQYIAIGVSSETVANSSGMMVRDVQELASLVYADVAGETIHAGQILENRVPGFATGLPVTVSAQIANTGNVHDVAEVVISVKNQLTGEVILPRADWSGRFTELIMPESERYVSREISGLPALGVFEVTQKITFLEDVSEVTQTLVVCPLWFMLLVLMTLGALVGTVVGLVRRRKKKATETEPTLESD